MLWPFNHFRRPHAPQRGTIEAIYGMIVAQAREPLFYRAMGVPDTVNGLTLGCFLGEGGRLGLPVVDEPALSGRSVPAAKQLLPTSVAAGLRVTPPPREHLAADDASNRRKLRE
jgi:hypothetical protein